MHSFKKNIRNILIFRNDRFGEFLLNIPALRVLKETFTEANLIVVINPYIRDLAECIPFIDEIVEWGQEKHSLFEKFRFINLLKTKNTDIAIMLNPSKEFNIFTYLAGIPIRVGYARKWEFLLTHKIEDKKYLGQKHEVEYNLDLIRKIGIDSQDKSLLIPINNEDKNFVESLLKEYSIVKLDLLIALHPWTSDPVKQWPVENFSQLAVRLSREFNHKVIIIGGKDEVEQSQKFCKDSPNLVNLTGKLTLRQSAALFKKCRLLVSNDSGPVHLASAVGTPVIALFRNDIPAKSARRWGPWGEGHIVIEKSNLADIAVDEVLVKIQEALNR